MPYNVDDLQATNAAMVLVVGETGSGKSFFIDKIAPGKVDVGHSWTSCTQVSQLVEAKIGNTETLLIDTPGFNDTSRSDADILLEISKSLTVQYQMRVKLKGVILLQNISAVRMTGSARRQIDLFQRILGQENYSNVLLVTTHWPTVTEGKIAAQIRESELRVEFWRELLDGGAKMMRFDGTSMAAKSIVSQLLGKRGIVLALQTEMVEKRLGLSQTAAGSFALREREKQLREHDLLSQQYGGAPSKRDENRLSELKRELQLSSEDQEKLKADVVADIEERVLKKVEEQFEKAGKKPTRVNIISWIIGIVGIGLNIAVAAVGGGGL